MKKIILLGFLISSSVYSQTSGTTEQSSNKIKVYTPSSSAASAAESYKWTVKTDFFSFASGEFPIIGEYRVLKNMSVEASAGVTYGFYENTSLFEDGYSGSGTTFESKAAMGSCFRAGLKYYASSDYDAIEGWAFGLQFFTRTNNREYKANSENDYSQNQYDLNGQQDSRNKTGLELTISKQIFSDSNISVEWLMGIGFAKVKHDFLIGNSSYDNNGKNIYSLKTNTTEETVPNFHFGFRLGFGN
jgi:hypothetical protein